ncbi:MAG TPA: hypothetical protein VMM18_09290 [Gemmatimonadaceae bacterium]|nr:hypothetical protein [Gemmatimonadaceae bacterium]
MIPRFSLALLLLASAPAAAAAQGTFASQGLGYPFGQLGTRAVSSGGSIGELDARSQINPAAVGLWGGRALYLQYEPEYRRISGDGIEDAQRFIRFPVLTGAISIGPRTTLAFSASSLLDRTGMAREERTEVIGGEEVVFVQTTRSDGAINDLRFAGARRITETVFVGLGIHAITGQIRQFLGWEFETPGFDSLSQRSRSSFSGLAFSGGAVWLPAQGIAIAGSGRLGAGLTRYVDDTSRGTATVPHRAGIAVTVDRISGASFSANVGWDGWTSLEPLARGPAGEGAHVHDTRTMGLGAEIEGPRMFGAVLPLRIGARWRELPFSPTAEPVVETSFGGGFGVPLRGGFSTIDIGLQYARRSSDLAFRERSLLLSMALTIRP